MYLTETLLLVPSLIIMEFHLIVNNIPAESVSFLVKNPNEV
jgi:hypothetical protein